MYTPRERSSGGYIEISLSVRLYVSLSVCAESCINMRRCVAYIHDPDTTFNFDLKVKFIGFLTCFRFRLITFFWIDIGLPNLAQGCTPSDNVSRSFMISIQCWPLTSRSNLKAFVMSSCTTCNFCLLWHWHIKFGRLVYHHERMCQVHSWSWYNLELWHQGKIYRIYDIALCSGLSFFVL